MLVSVLAFSHDANPEVMWECFGFDEPWNGWASPIVDAETLVDVLEDAKRCCWVKGEVFYTSADAGPDGDEVVVVLGTDDNGYYHLRDLGWTFMEARVHSAKVLPFKTNNRI